jgi:hypothetical protein
MVGGAVAGVQVYQRCDSVVGGAVVGAQAYRRSDGTRAELEEAECWSQRWRMSVERGGDGRRREWRRGRREHTRQLHRELMSFERKRIEIVELVFILFKLSATVLDENR